MQKLLAKMAIAVMLVAPFALPLSAQASVVTTWNVTGNFVVNMEYLGNLYSHDMVLSQDSLGNLTGHGGSPAGANVYTWVITSGTISGNTVDFFANYTATADAVTPQTVLHVTATIAPDGTLSGTWSDNYQGGARTGALTTVSGAAVALNAQDFGVVNYDTGLGFLKGYTAGFGLTNTNLAGAQSVVVQLFSGATLLQTNTAIISKFNTDITGTQFSSPFDVSGNFDYATDGYWTNVRQAEFGQSVPATRVVATVTLADGRVVTAENTNLTGDPTTIFPLVVTNPATNITTSDATLNGLNGGVAATGHSFWVSLAPIDTSTPNIPAGVYSTPDFGAITANTAFSATLSSLTTSGVPGNMPAVTANTKYYFVAWSLVNGTWTPGAVLNFTTATIVPTTPGTKEACMSNGWKAFTDGTNHFKNQGDCVSFVATGGKNKAAGN